MKMLRKEGNPVLSKMGATPGGLSKCSSVGEPGTEQPATLPALKSLRAASPSHRTRLFPASGPCPELLAPLSTPSSPWFQGRRERPGAPGAAEAVPAAHPPAALRSFKEGVGGLEAANRLGTTPEYADGHPGGQHWGPATFLRLGCLPRLWPVGSGRQRLVPSHWLLRMSIWDLGR